MPKLPPGTKVDFGVYTDKPQQLVLVYSPEVSELWFTNMRKVFEQEKYSEAVMLKDLENIMR